MTVSNETIDASRIQTNDATISQVAVAVFDTGQGLHSGILHNDKGVIRLLEQGFHLVTRNRPAEESYLRYSNRFVFVDPLLLEDRAKVLAALCRLVGRKFAPADDDNTQKQGIPYGLAPDPKARFHTKTGDLKLVGTCGLNCATFVVVMFESASIRFIDFTGWKRRDDDKQIQLDLCDKLASWVDAKVAKIDHLKKMEKEIGCDRVRPEEVVGVCLIGRPGQYEQVATAGMMVKSTLSERVIKMLPAAASATQSAAPTLQAPNSASTGPLQ